MPQLRSSSPTANAGDYYPSIPFRLKYYLVYTVFGITSMSAQTVTVLWMGTVYLTFTDVGEGRPILLLHGGAGPQSMAGFAQMLTARHPVHVYAPTLPGFNGTPRPDWLTNPRQVARRSRDSWTSST